jgi:hypothetical protein
MPNTKREQMLPHKKKGEQMLTRNKKENRWSSTKKKRTDAPPKKTDAVLNIIV